MHVCKVFPTCSSPEHACTLYITVRVWRSQDSEAQHEHTDFVRVSARSAELLVNDNGYSGLFRVHALPICPGPERRQHTTRGYGARGCDFFFCVFRLLKVVSQGTPFRVRARAKGVACETRRYSAAYFTKWWCPPYMDVQLDENFNSMALSIHLL